MEFIECCDLYGNRSHISLSAVLGVRSQLNDASIKAEADEYTLDGARHCVASIHEDWRQEFQGKFVNVELHITPDTRAAIFGADYAGPVFWDAVGNDMSGIDSSGFPANVKDRICLVCDVAVRSLRGTLEARIKEAEIDAKIAVNRAAHEAFVTRKRRHRAASRREDALPP
nr:hypothetical protein [uncultured Rhodopila sp.]